MLTLHSRQRLADGGDCPVQRELILTLSYRQAAEAARAAPGRRHDDARRGVELERRWGST
jgi:hypothetical protein